LESPTRAATRPISQWTGIRSRFRSIAASFPHTGRKIGLFGG
jgi:hypothetical protein